MGLAYKWEKKDIGRQANKAELATAQKAMKEVATAYFADAQFNSRRWVGPASGLAASLRNMEPLKAETYALTFLYDIKGSLS